MKALLLTAAAFLAFTGSLFAQNLPPDYNWEVGVNGGLSFFTRPVGPANNYTGNSTQTVGDISVRLNYFINPHWMLNLDIGERHWQSQGTWQLNDIYGQPLKAEPITFVVADHAINESVGINYVIPFYTRYNTFIRSNINFGVTVGMMNTVNDGSIGYSTYKQAPDSNYRYVSKYDYASGQGFTFGVQVGYTYYIIPRLGINIDLAVRYAHVKTGDEHYASENNTFTSLYFPETIGLRWRF